MTTERHEHDQDPSRFTASPLPDALASPQLIAAGDLDVASGDQPVPIAVWRVADMVAAGRATVDALTPRLAALLVGSYTRPGDTVVSVGDDAALAGAAGAGGRTYVAIRDADQLAHLGHVAGTVALIVLPWPPPGRPAGMDRARLIRMFRACRRLMARQGCTIVALASGPAGDTYEGHSESLIPAAFRAGLEWLQHIVAVTFPSAEQRLGTREAAINPVTSSSATHAAVHLDLLIFTARSGRRD